MQCSYNINVHFIIVQHFTHKASMMNIHAKVNAQNTDWLMSVFVNELPHPMYIVNKVRQCMQYCWTIMGGTLALSTLSNCFSQIYLLWTKDLFQKMSECLNLGFFLSMLCLPRGVFQASYLLLTSIATLIKYMSIVNSHAPI